MYFSVTFYDEDGWEVEDHFLNIEQAKTFADECKENENYIRLSQVWTIDY